MGYFPIFKNFVEVRLADPVAVGDTTIRVADIDSFPDVIGAEYFLPCVLSDTSRKTREIVHAIAIDKDEKTLTVERAKEGTIAKAWPVNTTYFYHAPTAITFDRLYEIVEDATGISPAAFGPYQQINTKAWDDSTDYQPGAIVKGSDGNLYVALEENGPSTSAVDPVEELDYDTSSTTKFWNCITNVHVWRSDPLDRGQAEQSGTIIGPMEPSLRNKMLRDVTCIGSKNLRNVTHGMAGIIAIGDGVMSEGNASVFNIGIGNLALHNVNGHYYYSEAPGLLDGDRNVAVGSLGLFGLTTGRANVAFGRDTGQCITTGSYNSCLGYGAIGGDAPMGLSGAIEVQNPLTGSFNTGVGSRSMCRLSGTSEENSALGYSAFYNARVANRNCVIGTNAMLYTQRNTSKNGKAIIFTPALGQGETYNASYSQTGTTMVITYAGHTATAGCLVNLRFVQNQSGEDPIFAMTSTDPQWLTVASVIDTSTFTITTPKSMTASGHCVILAFELDTDPAEMDELADENVVIGRNAGRNAHSAAQTVIIGANAASMEAVSSGNKILMSTIVGSLAGYSANTLTYFDALGYSAGRYLTSAENSISIGRASSGTGSLDRTIFVGSYAGNTGGTTDQSIEYHNTVGVGNAIYRNVTESTIAGATACGASACMNTTSTNLGTFIGYRAGDRPAALDYCTCLGALAMAGDETATTGYSYSTAIGYNAQVDGNHQIQLGTSSDTVEVYTAVHVRSDARDKTDIRDTELGLEFISALRPVDFKWDYRDSYKDIVEHEVETIDAEGNPVKETVLETITHEKDGSRKRIRYHHGFLAQDVKAVMDAQGIDFGGYQDHKINGGGDALTLGYEELIAPIVKAIQQINARVSALETE